MNRNKKLFIIVLIGLLIVSSLAVAFNHPESKSTITNSSKNRTVPIEVDPRIPDVSKLNAKINGSLDEKINKSEAIFMAHVFQVFEGASWDDKVSKSSNGNYLTVFFGDSNDGIKIDVNTGRSKFSNSAYSYSGSYDKYYGWQSFNRVKADYVFSFLTEGIRQVYQTELVFTDVKRLKINGSEVWRASIVNVDWVDYFDPDEPIKLINPTLYRYAYFDPATGYTRLGSDEWMSPKELDEWYSHVRKPKRQFQNALRYLYPE